jgi:hypothetical protein
MFSIVAFGEEVLVGIIRRAERAIEVGFDKFRSRAVDGADGCWIADAVAIWG